MAREVIHWSYRHGDWQGVPWQEMQPYELLSRLLYLHGFNHEDFLKALEQGELSLESEGRFVPSAWLRVRPDASPLSETVWNLEAGGGKGVRESWWVGLFFYQLPWEWYRLRRLVLSCGGSGVEPASSTGVRADSASVFA